MNKLFNGAPKLLLTIVQAWADIAGGGFFFFETRCFSRNPAARNFISAFGSAWRYYISVGGVTTKM
ncbi:hypothetical protein KJ068_08065 [bacterium]|nr:hypothetical protein [bacterium]